MPHEQLGCFHVLAIANSAAVNTRCMYLFEFEFLSVLDRCLGVGLLGHMVALFLGTSALFSIVAEPVYIPISCVGGFPFLCIFSSSVQSLSCVRLFATPWTAARQASLSVTNSWSSPKLMSIESMMPSNHLILCRPLLLLPSIFPSIRVFSNEIKILITVPRRGKS